MFAIICPVHHRRTLIFGSDISALRNTAAGIALDFTCSCGATGTWLTGRGVEERLISHGRASATALAVA